MDFKVNYEKLKSNFENNSTTIQNYINKRELEIKRLNLSLERLIDERDSLPLDYPSREAVVEEYNKNINMVENELKVLLTPSKEMFSKTLDETMEFRKEIEDEKRNIETLINEIERENRRLKFELHEWVMDHKMLDREYYDMSNRLLNNNGIIANLRMILEQYNNLKESIRDYENEIYQPERINDILNRRDDLTPKQKEEDKKIEDETPEKEIEEDKKIEDEIPVEEKDEDKNVEEETPVEEIEEGKEIISTYEAALEEYKRLLEMYNEELDTLYELQEKYENGKIEYLEYKEFALYMVDRYRFILEAYNKIKALYEKESTVSEYFTNEELLKQLEELENQAKEIWQQQVQVENGETPDNSLNAINEKIRLIKEELELRKTNPLRGLTIEELEEKRKELYKKIAEQQNEAEYHFRTHQENGLEGYEEDEIDKGLKEISKEIARRQPKEKETPEKPNQPMMIIEKEIEIDPVPPVPTPVPPEPIPEEQKNNYTLEAIIQKVIGDENISIKQGKNYMASQIKVYNPMPKNNWGNGYKLVSIPRKIGAFIMIPFNGLKKLIGKIRTTEETKLSVEKMQERIDSLTDEEIEIFMKQYKGTTALGFRLPKLFNEMMRVRIIKYITPRIERINNRIAELIAQIDFHKKIADGIEERMNDPKLSAEERTKLSELHKQAYIKCASEIREMNSLKREGNELQSGNGLHAVEEELKATNSKMNYKGGRFAKDGEIDSELWQSLGKYSQVIEFSNDPYEIVAAYYSQKELYIENTKEKRSILNLGSKVTSGKLDYRPFVENLYYGNDPYVSDLISSIILASSLASLTNTLITNAKNANVINNSQFDKLKDTIEGKGTKIEDGMISDIRRNGMDSENLAERSINDSHNYHLGTQSYKVDDTLHHSETANLSTYCEDRITDLTSKYNSGALTHPQFIRELEKVKSESTRFYEDYVSRYSQNLEEYAKVHPEFDYTAILNGLKGIANSQGASVTMTDYLVQVYEQAYNLINFNNISQISQTLNSTSVIPPILTTVAATAKVVEEDKKIQKSANSTEWDKEGKFAELLEMIKKGEITKKEEVEQAIDDSITTGRVL